MMLFVLSSLGAPGATAANGRLRNSRNLDRFTLCFLFCDRLEAGPLARLLPSHPDNLHYQSLRLNHTPTALVLIVSAVYLRMERKRFHLVLIHPVDATSRGFAPTQSLSLAESRDYRAHAISAHLSVGCLLPSDLTFSVRCRLLHRSDSLLDLSSSEHTEPRASVSEYGARSAGLLIFLDPDCWPSFGHQSYIYQYDGVFCHLADSFALGIETVWPAR